MLLDKDGNSSTRLRSLDAYRGFIMLAMASGGAGMLAGFIDNGESFGSSVVHWLRQQLDHVPWRGCAFWDLIQPSFMFMVGVAMPFSFASRSARGETWARMFGHALLRSLILIVLAVFLASNDSRFTHYSFVNVLGQIGLGYSFVFLLLGRRPAVQFAAAVAILVADWMLFALYPLPDAEFPFAQYGAGETGNMMPGFFAHWNKNANVAAAFDRWFLNLFSHPSDHPFVFNEGGYATLNFIPSMATMIFGVLAGELLRSNRDRMAKLRTLLLAGALCWSLGLVLDATVCPSIKRIWTPSWTIYSTGWTCWMLAAFYGVIDVAGYRRWSFPLVVVGMNSIAIYMMSQLMKPYVASSLRTHFGPDLFAGPYGPLVRASSTLLVFWLICFWMYRQKIFIKI
jgi:heparan-alpha-glucosaminide N-acetyltransferase